MSCLADVGQVCEEGTQLQAGRVNLVVVYGLTSYTEHLNFHRPQSEFTSLFGSIRIVFALSISRHEIANEDQRFCLGECQVQSG